MGTDVEKPAASIAVVDSGVEVFVVLEGKVDLSAEKARLEKEIATAQKELAAARRPLPTRLCGQGRARGGAEEEGPCS